MTTDLLAHLGDPTPDAVLAARTAAGQTQAEAAATIDMPRALRWSEIERGVARLDRARWALYLLATGQHPGMLVCSRTSV